MLRLGVCLLGVSVGGVLGAWLVGRVMAGMRGNDTRMRSLGYGTFRYNLACVVLAGRLAGMAGDLAAAQFGVVNPDMLGWHLSGTVLMMVILGGMGTLAGPALGAAAMLLLELGLQSLPVVGDIHLGKHWQLPLGIVIVLFALYLPKGLTGIPGRAHGDD